VFWVEEQKYSIVTEDFVTDKKMLSNHQLVGQVKYGGVIGKKEPKSGFRTYPAKVVATSGK